MSFGPWMTCISGLLQGICPEIAAQLKPNLSGLFGGVVRGYLPQAWAFVTESETVTLQVDTGGNASVMSGRSAQPDVLIETSHAVLSAALRTRNAASVPKGPVKVTPLTPKGGTAFRFLRGRIGL